MLNSIFRAAIGSRNCRIFMTGRRIMSHYRRNIRREHSRWLCRRRESRIILLTVCLNRTMPCLFLEDSMRLEDRVDSRECWLILVRTPRTSPGYWHPDRIGNRLELGSSTVERVREGSCLRVRSGRLEPHSISLVLNLSRKDNLAA